MYLAKKVICYTGVIMSIISLTPVPALNSIVYFSTAGYTFKVDKFCDKDGDNCLYVRKETGWSLDSAGVISIHEHYLDAVKGGYLLTRVECDPETSIKILFPGATPEVQYTSGVCEKRGRNAVRMPVVLSEM